jgi:hypothetical protein
LNHFLAYLNPLSLSPSLSPSQLDATPIVLVLENILKFISIQSNLKGSLPQLLLSVKQDKLLVQQLKLIY